MCVVWDTKQLVVPSLVDVNIQAHKHVLILINIIDFHHRRSSTLIDTCIDVHQRLSTLVSTFPLTLIDVFWRQSTLIDAHFTHRRLLTLHLYLSTQISMLINVHRRALTCIDVHWCEINFLWHLSTLIDVYFMTFRHPRIHPPLSTSIDAFVDVYRRSTLIDACLDTC